MTSAGRSGIELIPFEEALARVLAAARPLALETVPLADALGLVLAADVVADADVPAFPRCSMDGYAFRASDTAGAPVVLRVTRTAPAGTLISEPIGPAEAVKVMTGAPLPAGCDAVEAVERTQPALGGVRLTEPVAVGQHVAPRGGDLRAGAVAVAAGTRVAPSHVGLLASAGAARVVVSRRPSACVVPTGDELVDVSAWPAPGQVRNSNGPMLGALARTLGCDPVTVLPPARDDERTLTDRLAAALASDVVLTCGGVSKGERDLVQDVLPALGVERIFHGVAMQPGKPVWFGRTATALVFGLPGNPVSALTCAWLFVGAAARALAGRDDALPRAVRARLVAPVRRKAGRAGILPARVAWSDDGLACRPLPSGGSADLVAAAAANAFWVAPLGREEFLAAEVVDVYLLAELPDASCASTAPPQGT